MRWSVVGVVVAAATAAATAAASGAGAQPRLPGSSSPVPKGLAPDRGQDRGNGRDRAPERNPRAPADVPPAYRPPPGMCRIWLDNVAPAQQPAPTDCGSAVRNRPANARVLFGDDYATGPDSGAGALPEGAVTVAAWTAGGAPRAAVRLHGPAAADDDDQPPARAAARPAPRPAARPATRAAARDPGDAVADGLAAPADDWEAGYAAGYRDAMRGLRPRVRGAERGAPADVAPGVGALGVDDRSPFVQTPGQLLPGQALPGQAVPGQLLPGDPAAGVTPFVVVPPAGGDPRFFNNGRFPPPGRANGVCLDRDGDGWCDDPRFGAPACRDLDGDGRCDDYPALAAAPLPATLPEMRAGEDVQRGVGSATALRWLGTSEVQARVTPSGRGGAPSRVVWLDANTGQLLQVWTDRNGDGVADRVEIYRNGRRVKLIGR